MTSSASSAVRAALEAEAHEVHAEQRGRRGFGSSTVQMLLVADRDAVLVDAVLDAPQPRRPRADERVRAGVVELEVLRAERRRRPGARGCASTTCASSRGRSEFLPNSVRRVTDDAERVAHRRVARRRIR